MTTLRQLQAEVGRFNASCPIGARVSVRMDNGQERITTTRAPAQVLSGHTAVVWLDGMCGAYLLDRVSPVREGKRHVD
jgi:hypothetical protein